jgi:hypothetical protein
MKRKLASGPYDHYDGFGSKWFLIAILVILFILFVCFWGFYGFGGFGGFGGGFFW